MIAVVAPYVGAWIETGVGQIYLQGQLVAPYVGAWIETYIFCIVRWTRGRTLRGCVDWNPNTLTSITAICSRTLRGCVDWNTPLKDSGRREQSHPTWVRGLKLLCLPYSLHAAVSARRYTQRKQAYSRSCAPCLYTSVSIFYTLKKSFAFYEKNLQKSLHISKILTTFAHVR